MSDRFHRPATPGDRFFEAITGDDDPARLSEAADRAATLLVRGAHDSADSGVAERVVRLAETEGLETLAELWAGASPESLAGCLWRLYVLRAWVYADPERAAHEFEAGRLSAPVARVVAGVADPPGPDELKSMVDEVLRGIADRDFADVLFRAAAFARVVTEGARARRDHPHEETARARARRAARASRSRGTRARAG
ncbi:MAG: hypothetical protein R2734_14745 [Nocardioides sp.]